jgi:hypothetical protein
VNATLGSQIFDYAQAVANGQQPVTLDEIEKRHLSLEEPVRPLGVPESPRYPQTGRNWRVLVSTALVVLGIAGSSAVLLRATGSGDATVPAAATDPLSDHIWSQIVDDAGAFDGPEYDQGVGFARMASVTTGGTGLVAVGWRGSYALSLNATVWTSVDGTTWTRVGGDELSTVGSQAMLAVTEGGPGLVAVGSDTQSGIDTVPAVWTSPDGIAWTRLPLDESRVRAAGGGEMTSVTTGGPGLVAVGWVGRGFSRVAAVWTSVNGITWDPVPHDASVFGGDDQEDGDTFNTRMLSVTGGGPGLVAVGATGSDLGGSAAVWTSIDGLSWSRVPHDESIFKGSMMSVTAGGVGLVAVGSTSDASANAAAWTSVDGLSWSRVPHDESVFGGSATQTMSSVTAGESGVVAVGWSGSELGLRSAAAVWTSADGTVWFRVPDRDSVFRRFGPGPGDGDRVMTSVTTAGTNLVAVGSDWPRASVWVGSTAN